MPIRQFVFYIFISISYIDPAGKTVRNASNLTVETVNFRSVRVQGFTVPRSEFKDWSPFLNPYMKLNGVIPDGEVIFRDTILCIGIFKNVKIQAPKYK
jgi:hypothetical protein